MDLPVFQPVYLFFVLVPIFTGALFTIFSARHHSKARELNNSNGLTGLEVATRIAQNSRIRFKVEVVSTAKQPLWLPKQEILQLSREQAHGRSLDNITVLAHELGHIQQLQQHPQFSYLVLNIESGISVINNLSYIALVIALILQWSPLAWLGLLLLTLALILALVTVPQELDASNRAWQLLRSDNIVYNKEKDDVHAVLRACNVSYLTVLIGSLGSIFSFIFSPGLRRSKTTGP